MRRGQNYLFFALEAEILRRNLWLFQMSQKIWQRTLYAMPKIDMRGNISNIYELGKLKLYAIWP